MTKIEELNFVKNISENEAEILIHGEIGFNGISGNLVAEDIRFLDTLGLENINIRINTAGGSVLDAFSIVSAIIHAETNITTINDGIAASAGSFILVAGDKRKALSFAKVMIHDPFDQKNPTKKTPMIENVREQIMNIFQSSAGLDEEGMSRLFNGQEVWLSAEESKELNIIDEIVEIKIKGEVKAKNFLDTCETVQDCFELCNSFHRESNTQNDMKTIINTLNLDAESSEDQVNEAITEIVNENETLKSEKGELEEAKNTLETEKTELEGKVSDLENKVKEFEAQELESIVDNAIKAGKFKEEQKEELIAQGEKDIEALKNMIELVATPAKRITDGIKEGESKVKGLTQEDRDKGLRFLEREKPSLVNKIFNEDKELYKELFKAEYGVDYKS